MNIILLPLFLYEYFQKNLYVLFFFYIKINIFDKVFIFSQFLFIKGEKDFKFIFKLYLFLNRFLFNLAVYLEKVLIK